MSNPLQLTNHNYMLRNDLGNKTIDKVAKMSEVQYLYISIH